MPARIYGERDLVWVFAYRPFGSDPPPRYGFLTSADSGTQTTLGHNKIDGVYPAQLIIGANSPKPPRASKQTATGLESSFCSAARVDTLRTEGWKITPAKLRNGASGSKSKVVYVLNEGLKIAWRMPKYIYDRLGADKAGLGIVDAPSNALDLIFGASYPRLPRVKKLLIGNPTDPTNGTLTTFCDPSKLDTLPAGWAIVRASSVQSRF